SDRQHADKTAILDAPHFGHGANQSSRMLNLRPDVRCGGWIIRGNIGVNFFNFSERGFGKSDSHGRRLRPNTADTRSSEANRPSRISWRLRSIASRSSGES